MFEFGRENRWAKVSWERVSTELALPKTTVKERAERARSERTVMMRVGLIAELGIVGF